MADSWDRSAVRRNILSQTNGKLRLSYDAAQCLSHSAMACSSVTSRGRSNHVRWPVVRASVSTWMLRPTVSAGGTGTEYTQNSVGVEVRSEPRARAGPEGSTHARYARCCRSVRPCLNTASSTSAGSTDTSSEMSRTHVHQATYEARSIRVDSGHTFPNI